MQIVLINLQILEDEQTTGWFSLYFILSFHLLALFIKSISLQGSNSTTEGLVGFTTRDSPAQIKFFTNESWSMNTSHQVCQELGYRRGASATVSGNVYDPVHLNNSSKYGALRCAKTTTNLTDCWYESRGFNGISQHGQDMIIAVVCCRREYSLVWSMYARGSFQLKALSHTTI